MKKSTIYFKHINAIWNGAGLDEIEARIEKLPANTVVKMGRLSRCSQPMEIVKGTLMLLNKYGIGYEIEF